MTVAASRQGKNARSNLERTLDLGMERPLVGAVPFIGTFSDFESPVCPGQLASHFYIYDCVEFAGIDLLRHGAVDGPGAHPVG